MEFIRGKYELDNPNYIVKLFNMMTFDEKRMFREYNSFDMLRTVIGLKKEFHHHGEYNNSKHKLYTRGNGTIGTDITNLLDIINIKLSSSITSTPYAIRGELIISKTKFKKYSVVY